MYIISNNEKFKIQMPQQLYNGEDLRGQTIYVHITLLKEKEALLIDLVNAVIECMDCYDVDHRKYAPELWVYAYLGEKIYELKIEWEMEETDYLTQLANQFKL